MLRSCLQKVEILLANCRAHGRRQFVDVAANSPDECRYVLKMLGQVYGYDAEARERSLLADKLESGVNRNRFL
jgi:transposase